MATAKKPTQVRTWDGFSASRLDEWLSVDMLAAWESLKNECPEGFEIRGIAPAHDNGVDGWAAIAYGYRNCFMGIALSPTKAMDLLRELLFDLDKRERDRLNSRRTSGASPAP